MVQKRGSLSKGLIIANESKVRVGVLKSLASRAFAKRAGRIWKKPFQMNTSFVLCQSDIRWWH